MSEDIGTDPEFVSSLLIYNYTLHSAVLTHTSMCTLQINILDLPNKLTTLNWPGPNIT